MSQIVDNDDNHSITASDFVQFGQSGDFVDSQKHQQQQRFGYQNQLDWTMNPGSPGNYGQYLKELNLKIAALEVVFLGDCFMMSNQLGIRQNSYSQSANRYIVFLQFLRNLKVRS
jgi:hypothetical protein